MCWGHTVVGRNGILRTYICGEGGSVEDIRLWEGGVVVGL